MVRQHSPPKSPKLNPINHLQPQAKITAVRENYPAVRQTPPPNPRNPFKITNLQLTPKITPVRQYLHKGFLFLFFPLILPLLLLPLP